MRRERKFGKVSRPGALRPRLGLWDAPNTGTARRHAPRNAAKSAPRPCSAACLVLGLPIQLSVPEWQIAQSPRRSRVSGCEIDTLSSRTPSKLLKIHAGELARSLHFRRRFRVAGGEPSAPQRANSLASASKHCVAVFRQTTHRSCACPCRLCPCSDTIAARSCVTPLSRACLPAAISVKFRRGE
jgi:hypothetical protein